jgi:UDP-glucuronate decarboxylase
MDKMNNLEMEAVKRVASLPYDWSRFNNKVLLISGGTGFIGSFLIEVLRYRTNCFGNTIKVVSLSRRGGVSDDYLENLAVDVCNPIDYTGDVDFVLHLASNTHPKQYAEDPIGTILTNIDGCNNLLRLAVEKKARFLLASSVEIYGQGTEKPMDEHYCGYIDCNQARAGYNEAKRTCEALTQSYRQRFGIDAVIVRLARVFGPDKKKDTKAMSQFMDKAVLGDEIVMKSHGEQRYSYVYIADAVSALIKVLLDGINGEAYNISDDDDGRTLRGYAEYLAMLSNQKVKFEIENNSAVSKATFAIMDTNKLKALGWMPLYTVCQGLKETYTIKRQENTDC